MKAKSKPNQECTQDLSVYLSEIYALERKTEAIWADRIEKIPEANINIADYLRGHVYQKKQHIASLKKCLQKLNINDPGRDAPSPHYIADIGLQIATDNIESETFCNTAFERFEAAIYRKVIECSKEAGHDDIAEVCETILRQEEEVARWLEHALHEIPLNNTNMDTTPEVAQGEGFLIDARLMNLRHPETTPDECDIIDNAPDKKPTKKETQI